MKKAIVICATSGIGKEVARLLVKDNYMVVIAGRRKELLNKLYLEDTELYLPLDIDINNIQETKSKLDSLSKEMNRIDLIVFCAGLGGDNVELNVDTEMKMVETNVLGFTFVMDWFYHFFEQQNAGHIVAVTSVAGFRGNRIAPAYFASKSFQINYLEGLKQKCYKTKNNILITDIRPGFVSTDMLTRSNLPWTTKPNKAAELIAINIKRKNRIVYITKRWRLIAILLKSIPSVLYSKL